VRKHPDALTISQLVPAAFVAWLVSGAVGAALGLPIVAPTLIISVALYAGLLLSFSGLLGFRYDWRHFFVAPAVYLVIHLGLGLGFWAEAVRSLWAKPAAKLRPLAIRRSSSSKE
jgi:hypothetical protein